MLLAGEVGMIAIQKQSRKVMAAAMPPKEPKDGEQNIVEVCSR